jgi:hypothetical protein
MKKIIFSGALLMLLGAGCVPFSSFSGVNQTTPDTSAQQAEETSPVAPAEIEQQYFSSSLRVIKVIKNPFNDSFLVLATERAPEKNDTSCGSIYTSPTCFFFVEKDYVAGAPEPRLAASLTQTGYVDFDTPIRFIDADRIQFTGFEGDAGYSSERTWEVNLKTGEGKLLNEKNSQNDQL